MSQVVLEKKGLLPVLRMFDEHGWKGSFSSGNYRIVNGAYDLWFQVYYNNVAIIDCIDSKLNIDQPKYKNIDWAVATILKKFPHIKYKKEESDIVTLTVAECSEYHNFGEFHENIQTVDEAISIFNSIPSSRMNGVPSIGINIHHANTQSWEDTTVDLLIGKHMDLDILCYVSELVTNNESAKIIAELIAKSKDVTIRGEIPDKIRGLL